MAVFDDLPEGTIAVPATYPNAMANNVNMHPFPPDADQFTLQDAPILIDGAKGSAFDANPPEEP